MINRLILSNGPFTSIIALSIFFTSYKKNDKTFILGYFKNISKDKQNINQNIYETNDVKIDSIYNIFDYYTSLKIISKKSLRLDLPDKLDEIYIPINTKSYYWYKIFANISKAKIIFYEEGMFSYIKPIFSTKLRSVMSKSKNYYVFYNDNLKTLLLQNCPNVLFEQIEKNNLKLIIENYGKSLNIDTSYLQKYPNSNTKYALIVPQYYFQNKKNKYQALISDYTTIINSLIDNGYKILLKDHPKGNKKLYNLIQCPNKEENIIELNANYPIEVFYSQLNVNLVFSVYSTSLFTLDYLYNAKVFTSNKMLNNRISLLSIFPTLTALLAKYNIKKIEDMLNINQSNIIDNKDINPAILSNEKNIILNISIKILQYIL
jgi:hypothetical protein